MVLDFGLSGVFFLREASLYQPPRYNYNHYDTHRDDLRTSMGLKIFLKVNSAGTSWL